MHFWNGIKLAVLFSLLVGTAAAQSPSQIVVMPVSDPKMVYTVQLAPTHPGDALIIETLLGGGPAWTVTDTQNNTWLQANSDYAGLQYVPATRGGPETITIKFSRPDYMAAIVMEWPVSLVLWDTLPERCLGLECNPIIGGQSLTYIDGSAIGNSFPLTTTGSDEVLIGYGIHMLSTPVSGEGWTMAGVTNGLYMQYQLAPRPGIFTSTVNLASPQPEGAYGNHGIVAFKPIGFVP